MTYWLVTTCHTYVVVDRDTWEWAVHLNWYLKKGYPCHYTRKGEAYLHRELFDFPCGHVHHRDGDPLNCQRNNLEVMSPAAHARIHDRGRITRERWYTAPPRSRSGYKGVCWHRGQQRWVTQAVVNGRNQAIGYFDTPEEAALAYDTIVVTCRGVGHYTNLIPNE